MSESVRIPVQPMFGHRSPGLPTGRGDVAVRLRNRQHGRHGVVHRVMGVGHSNDPGKLGQSNGCAECNSGVFHILAETLQHRISLSCHPFTSHLRWQTRFLHWIKAKPAVLRCVFDTVSGDEKVREVGHKSGISFMLHCGGGFEAVSDLRWDGVSYSWSSDDGLGVGDGNW